MNFVYFYVLHFCLIHSVRDKVARVHLGNHHKYKKDPYEEVRYMKDYFVYGVDKEEVSTFVFLQRYQQKVHHKK